MTTTTELDETPTTGTVFDFPADRLPDAEHRIDLANRRLARAGIPDRFTWTTAEHVVTKTGEDGHPRAVRFVKLTLSAPALSLGGYRFLAAVDREEAGFVLRAAPDVDLHGWRPDTMTCEHCGHTRTRSTTYLVEATDGTRHQVGSSCVAAYTGVKPVGLWALTFDLGDTTDYDEDDYFGTPSSNLIRVDLALGVALAVSKNGRSFTSRGRSTTATPATVDVVLSALFGDDSRSADWRADMHTQAQQLVEDGTVRAVLDTLATDVDETSDYGMNLHTIARGEWVTYKNLGLLVSAVAPYARANERRVERAAVVPGYAAPVGARVAGTAVTVTKVRDFESYTPYGQARTSTLVLMTDGTGRVLKWFASSRQRVDVGDQLTLTAGTVKAHEVYEGVDQTVLTRVKYAPAEAAQ